MNRRDILHRLVGIAALLGAGATTLLHRQAWLAHASGPATGLEAALGLLTFALASLGVLLVIGGARCRDNWARNYERVAHQGNQRDVSRKRAQVHRKARTGHATAAAAADDKAIIASRATLATFLMRARQAATQTKPATETTEKFEPGAYQ